MKYIFAPTLLIVFLLFSCKEEETIYEVENFYGKWKLTNSTKSDYERCSIDSLIPVLTITREKLFFPRRDKASGCDTRQDLSFINKFDGKKFFIDDLGDVIIEYPILSQTDTSFTWLDGNSTAPSAPSFVESWQRID